MWGGGSGRNRMARLVEARSYISKNCSGERGGRMGSEMEMDGSRIFMAVLEWEKPTGREDCTREWIVLPGMNYKPQYVLSGSLKYIRCTEVWAIDGCSSTEPRGLLVTGYLPDRGFCWTMAWEPCNVHVGMSLSPWRIDRPLHGESRKVRVWAIWSEPRGRAWWVIHL
jgi:hypothetical protein